MASPGAIVRWRPGPSAYAVGSAPRSRCELRLFGEAATDTKLIRKFIGLMMALLVAVFFAPKSFAQNLPGSSSGAGQSDLPSLRPTETLSAPNNVAIFGSFQSGISGLTISPDGERLAAYVLDGLRIITWSPDGKYQRDFPRYTSSGPESHVLGFLSGHRILISSPAADTNDPEGWSKIEDVAFSVLDADTGQVLHNVPGPRPAGRSNENAAIDMAISPDERLVAVIFRDFVQRRIGIFATDNWRQVAALDLHTGEADDDLDPVALAFAPDGMTLAVAHGRKGRIKFYEVGSWKQLRSLATFPETPPPMDVLLLDAIAFSPDGSLVAVASHGGGSWWVSKDGHPVEEGFGTLKQIFPADPLRVYRVSDGGLVGSLGGFPGGLASSAQLAWSKAGDYLAFLDAVGDVRFWNPHRPGRSIIGAHMGRHCKTILFSTDGLRLFANFPGGVSVFDVVQAR